MTMKSHGLARRERLIRERDFESVYRERRSVSDERLVLYVRANSLGRSRIGSSVSGRWGNSVLRNRFRRYCREAFRLHKGDLPKGFDFIIIPRKGIDMTLEELTASLLDLARKGCSVSP
jgi:ribonuclease P protein component